MNNQPVSVSTGTSGSPLDQSEQLPYGIVTYVQLGGDTLLYDDVLQVKSLFAAIERALAWVEEPGNLARVYHRPTGCEQACYHRSNRGELRSWFHTPYGFLAL